MHGESNDGDTDSLQIYTINTQSAKADPKKVSRAKKLKNNIKDSVKRRQHVINKAFVVGGDSLIRVHGLDDYLKSIKKPVDKHNDIITINVSGGRYQTRLSTLENYPNTLLGNKKKRKYYWNNKKNEYFFDRHRACFESILYFYQSNGRLRRPDYVPLDTFLEEVSFFDLGPDAISQINKLENVSIIKYIDLPNWHWRRYIWFYLEYPQNSIFGRIIYFISMFLTVLSCITLAIETLPQYKEQTKILCENETNTLNQTSICTEIYSSPFFIIQTICISYFTIEFLLRLLSTPSYFKFMISIFNWIDLCTIVPYFVSLGLLLEHKETDLYDGSFLILRIFQILRFLRAFRIYLVFKQFKSLRVLSATLKESFIDFIIMIIILTIMAFLFGGAVYYVEQDTNGQIFDSIPRATYWGILTITTVGYGDMYPITIAGRILACVCALLGVAIGGMLVSVLVDSYQRVYNRKKFFPEQIMSAIDASDSEHDKKQDFIDRKLSGTRKNLSGISTVPVEPSAPVIFPKMNRKLSRYNSPSSYVRFIITITDDQTNNKFMRNIANDLMKELTEIIQTNGDRINLKLISPESNSSNDKLLPTNHLSSISEE